MQCLLLLCGLIGLVASHKHYAHIELKTVPQRFHVKHGQSKGQAAAWGSFHDKIKKTGFAYLEITTNATLPDNYQAYAAGILEGYFTRTLISQHYNNTMRDYCNGQEEYCQRLKQFLKSNLDYVNGHIKSSRKTDPYWFQTELALNQLTGIQDAWDSRKDESYFPEGDYEDVTKILFLNADGDFEDLEQALKAPVSRRIMGSGRCSALIKVVPNKDDLYTSQVTWSGYSTMLRILKKYTFNYNQVWWTDKPIPGHTVTFSSSPGRIFSGDDFHLISTGLATLETTIGNSNPALWKKVTPNCNLEWARTIVANRLATNGAEWAKLFAREPSGTYNNEWMIVDYNKFQPGQKALQPGLLTVLEEIPGKIEWADQTKLLESQGYWASYNVPFYKDIFHQSGCDANVAKYGDWFTYENSPRAKIFRRDHTKVTDMASMFKLMRYNDYQHDELSRCNCTPPYSAENAISARSDLNPANGTYPFSALGHRSHGATDAKITNSTLIKTLQFLAVAGPTYDPLPPFQWSKSGLNDLHEGHPDLWNFEPHVHEWEP